MTDPAINPGPAPDFLHAYLAGRDVACPGCGYNLRDLIGSRCPECGDVIVLRVGLAEPRQAAAITGLIGLTAGAGFNGLLLVIFGVHLIRDGFRVGNDLKFLIIDMGGLIALVLAMVLWLWNWRRLRRLRPGSRARLVVGCWGLTLVDLLVFALQMR